MDRQKKDIKHTLEAVLDTKSIKIKVKKKKIILKIGKFFFTKNEYDAFTAKYGIEFLSDNHSLDSRETIIISNNKRRTTKSKT
jgi:hypothetical protein